MNKKILILYGILLVSIFYVVGIGEATVCCEKMTGGAWCMNANEEECSTASNPFANNEPFRIAPTSCDATGYCRLGCCYNSQQGTCMPNTPKSVCTNNNGIWSGDSAGCEIPQCSRGCCLIGDQAAFVTQVNCKRLSAEYGLETNFRTDITSETECIATAGGDIKGACVFEKEFEKTCKMITQKECLDMQKNSPNATSVNFYEGILCSSEELGTNCGKSRKTTCVEGRDEVFFLDTCGNVANIYDSTKLEDNNYWRDIIPRDESCGAGLSNANSKTCGNCDYYYGSTCKKYDSKKDKNRPVVGDNICRDLSCSYGGKTYLHGETWCASNSQSTDVPGAEWFRLVCYNSEVTVEQCAPFRQQVCAETTITNPGKEPFRVAACVANLWRDCVIQDNKLDCENVDLRDCTWAEGKSLLKDSNGYPLLVNNENKLVAADSPNLKSGTVQAACIPKFIPGLDFWNAEGESEQICAFADIDCTAKFEKGLLEGTWDCVENCECCVNDENGDGKDENVDCTGDANWNSFSSNYDKICSALGDCGKKKNYVGTIGYKYSESYLFIDGEPFKTSSNTNSNTKPEEQRGR